MAIKEYLQNCADSNISNNIVILNDIVQYDNSLKNNLFIIFIVLFPFFTHTFFDIYGIIILSIVLYVCCMSSFSYFIYGLISILLWIIICCTNYNFYSKAQLVPMLFFWSFSTYSLFHLEPYQINIDLENGTIEQIISRCYTKKIQLSNVNKIMRSILPLSDPMDTAKVVYIIEYSGNITEHFDIIGLKFKSQVVDSKKILKTIKLPPLTSKYDMEFTEQILVAFLNKVNSK